jgi:DNA repair protein RadC
VRENRQERGVVSVDADRLRRYRVPKYRLALVREATISTPWDKTVRQSGDVAAFMTPLVADLDREAFFVLLLDSKHQVVGLNAVATGSLNACLVHCREVFKAAILSNAASIVLVHNHPSSDPTPSNDDLFLTRRLHDAGMLLGIAVLDHVVVTADQHRYCSLADEGLLGGAR